MRTILESYRGCIGNDLAMANCNFYNSSVYVITAASKAGLINKELFDLIADQCIDGFEYVRGDSNQGPLDGETGALPLDYYGCWFVGAVYSTLASSHWHGRVGFLWILL